MIKKTFFQIKKKFSNSYVYLSALIFSLSLSFVTAMNSACNGLFNESAATSAGDQFVNLYKKWFWPLLIVNAVIFAVLKNEKAKGAAKTVLIGLVVVYLLCLLGPGVITATLSTIAGWFGV